MNENNRLKKYKLIFSLSSLLLLSLLSSIKKKNSNINIIEENDEFIEARIDNQYIFFGNKDFLDANGDEKSIKILDERNAIDNPNCKIYNSYRIINLYKEKEIVEMLLRHEESYPTVWDRTESSMIVEWICHNLGYIFNYERDRTTDVDLNNEDEEVYKIRCIKSKSVK